MVVHVVTDSSACLPPEVAARAGVSIMEIYTYGQGTDRTTAGLGALELTAMYARLLERGGDDGVLALHLSKELSSTWANAVSAAGVFDGTVRVIDTNTTGMVLGYAALCAAAVANDGGDLAEVADAANEVIREAKLWLYVHKLDALRKSGRLSTAQALLTTALAVKPILQVSGGELQLAARTRTQARAMDKLVDLVREEIVAEAKDAVAKSQEPRTVHIAVHQSDAQESAEDLLKRLRAMAEALRSERAILAAEYAAERAEKSEKAAKTEKAQKIEKTQQSDKVDDRHLAEHPAEDAGDEDSGDKQDDQKEAADQKSTTSSDPASDEDEFVELQIPPTSFEIVEMAPELATHTGPGSLGIATAKF